jgi:hypothetical protein
MFIQHPLKFQRKNAENGYGVKYLYACADVLLTATNFVMTTCGQSQVQ